MENAVMLSTLEHILFCVGADTTVSQSLLTQQGVPVVGLSNGKSYCFSSSLETWWDTKEWTDSADSQPGFAGNKGRKKTFAKSKARKNVWNS